MITIGELVPNEAWEKFKQDLEVIHRKLYVAAYNKAIDDVVNSMPFESDGFCTGAFEKRVLEQLKIRD